MARLASRVVRAWPKAERRRNLARIIVECEGVHIKVAHRLGIHRSSLYRYCYQYDLWPIFNAVRKARLEDEHAERQKKFRGGIMV